MMPAHTFKLGLACWPYSKHPIQLVLANIRTNEIMEQWDLTIAEAEDFVEHRKFLETDTIEMTAETHEVVAAQVKVAIAHASAAVN